MIKNADFSTVAVEQVSPAQDLPKITDWVIGNHNDNGEYIHTNDNLVTTESLINFAKNSNTATITFNQSDGSKYFALFCVKKE